MQAIVSLAGFSCDDFDPAVYNEALITILPNATMNDADCVDTGDDAAESVELTSEITVPLAASLHGGYTVMSYVLYFLEKAVSDGGFTAAIRVSSPHCAMRVSRNVSAPHDFVSSGARSGGSRSAAATRRNRSRGRVRRGGRRTSVEHGGCRSRIALGQHVHADARAHGVSHDGVSHDGFADQNLLAYGFADRDVCAHKRPDLTARPAMLRAVRIQVVMRL